MSPPKIPPEIAKETVLRYHERTKHSFQRFAESLGYMDWDNQPSPFRQFSGAPFVSLSQVESQDDPSYDELFTGRRSLNPELLTSRSVAQFFYDSLALSAWKAVGGARWSLRVNPSSGNLHPTEAYLVCGGLGGLDVGPGIWHYAPFSHALELRRELTPESWERFRAGSGYDCFVALSSIHWREAWKYGERAYRYCQQDVGHAVAAVSIACAVLGWQCEMVESCADGDLSLLLGLDRLDGEEAEHPDCLLGVVTSRTMTAAGFWSPSPLVEDIAAQPLLGEANRLSLSHHSWPIIDEVAEACAKPAIPELKRPIRSHWTAAFPERRVGAGRIIRQRRSATDMDGKTFLARSAFYRILARLLPTVGHPVWRAWPWSAHLSLGLFVHRVTDLPSGLYWLHRTPEEPEQVRQWMRSGFAWTRPEGCPAELPLFMLQAGEFGETANLICCRQAIAEDGVFAAAMIADFESPLSLHGAWFYRRLFWEAGAIGQVLYLEAEAAGARGTGIGCFFDDAMHQLLGLSGHRYQSLYHFTVGGAVEDSRLQTLPPYAHLSTDTVPASRPEAPD